jgi:glucokinase
VSDCVLAVDVGGTKLSAALVTRGLEVRHVEDVPTPRTDAGCDPGLVELAALVQRLGDHAAERGVRIAAMGLGFPEYTMDDRLTSREVFAWEVQPVVLFADAGVPVAVDSDVRCAARAEAAARQFDGTLLYVSWGTGISSTLVIGGRCLTGRRGEAIAMGELDVSAAVDPAWTGNLESFASGRGVQRRYSEATAVGDGGGDLDCAAITELATDGCREALGVVGPAATAVARALHACIGLLDPDLVVLGGGIGSSGSLLPRLAIEELTTLQTRPDPASVVPAKLGTRAGLLGAALAAWDRVGRTG